MIFKVQVGVALSRPPKVDRLSVVAVDADGWIDADTIACQMAMCHPDVVMAVSSKVLDGAL